jgi:hypothetical protein
MVQLTLEESIESKQETTESVNIPLLMITQRRKRTLSFSRRAKSERQKTYRHRLLLVL